MTKAKPITEAEVERLQEASEDVVYLTSQGYTPTDAIAKVASIGKLTKDQTNLLVHAYSAGLAAEKRASSGGPFTRLGEYELPDPDKVMEIVFGRPADAAQKEAASAGLPVSIQAIRLKLPPPNSPLIFAIWTKTFPCCQAKM